MAKSKSSLVGSMNLLMNIHSILKFHGPKSPHEIGDILLDRGILNPVSDVESILKSDAAGYFLVRRTTNLKGSWEAIR